MEIIRRPTERFQAVAETKVNPAVFQAAAFILFETAVAAYAFKSGNLELLWALSLPALFVIANKAPYIFPLGIYMFSIPFDSVFVSGETTYTKYLGILCIGSLFMKGLAERRLKNPDPAVFWLAAYVLWGVFSIIWSINVDVPAYIQRSGTAIGLLLLYLAASTYPFEEKEYDVLKKFILYGGLAAAAYTLVLSGFPHSGFGTNEVERATLSNGEMTTDPNYLAFSLLLPFGIAFKEMLRAKKNLKVFYYVAVLAVMACAIILTESRGGALGAVIISTVLLFHSARKGRSILAVLVLVLAIIYFAPKDYYQRTTTQLYETGGAGRLSILEVGLEAFKDNWFLGVGLDNFPEAYDRYTYSVPSAGFEGYSRASHNTFLQTAVEFGAVGALLIIVVFIQNFRLTGRSPNASDRDLLRASLLGYFAQAMTLDVMWRKSFWLLWMLIAIHNFAMYRRQKR